MLPNGVWDRIRSARAVAPVSVQRENNPASVGFAPVVVTSGEVDGWEAEPKEKIDALGATAAFDAVAGEMTGHLVAVIPSRGGVHVYGAMGSDASNVNPSDLIYREKRVEGFYVTAWLRESGPATIVGASPQRGTPLTRGWGRRMGGPARRPRTP